MGRRLYKARFTTKFGMPVFSAVSDILGESEILGVGIDFVGGGWEGRDLTLCYHEWNSGEDLGIIKKFLESQYGKSFIDMDVSDLQTIEEPIK